MKLNCKVGDLAIIIRERSGAMEHVGKIVSIASPSTLFPSSWVTSPELIHGRTGQLIDWRDSSLRPIRDQPGEDETLSWSDVPTGVTA